MRKPVRFEEVGRAKMVISHRHPRFDAGGIDHDLRGGLLRRLRIEVDLATNAAEAAPHGRHHQVFCRKPDRRMDRVDLPFHVANCTLLVCGRSVDATAKAVRYFPIETSYQKVPKRGEK